MSRREEFKTRMKALKLYRDTTGKGYWEWKVLALSEGGDNEYDNLMTTVATNALRDAANRGDTALVEKILKAKIGLPKEFYYPDSGAITPFLNIYDLPIIGDAFSLVDATKSLVLKDYDNASILYLNAVLPAAILGKSKLNWKEWNLKKKYIPEYEAIEREAKKNGTWLKNEDGTDFTGDAREWVAKRSKRFKDVFGDNYKEGYTGMRNPYDPNLTTDTYLGSKDRAYTYTLSKGTVKKKGDTGIAKLVVPDTDTYTVDALGNDWLHLTDKSINPYNFTNTNLIVSKITTPTISFKNIRDDGPFGMRDIAEDQFVIKANTPKKSVLYNNGDFDLSNPDIFKASLVPYIGYKLYNKANREDIPSYIDGGETDERTDHPIQVRLDLDLALNVADFTDRINHTDPNIGEYNPFYNAYDDTYGTVPLQEVTVTAPWTKLGRNNAAARRGMHYMQQGLEDAAKVAAPIVAGAAIPAMSSTGLLGKAVDLASIITNPLDPLNYLPYTRLVPKVRLAIQPIEDNLPLLLDIVNVNKAVEKMKSFYLSDEYYKRLKQAYNITGKKVFANQYLAHVLNNDLNKGVVVAPRFTKKGILGLTRFNETYLRPEIALSKTLKPEITNSIIDHEVAHASLKGDEAVKQAIRNIDPYNKSIANLRPATEIYKNLRLKDTKSLTDAMNYNLYETDIDEIRSRAYLLFLQAKEQNLDVDSFIDKFIFKDPSTPFGKLNAPEELNDLLRIMAPNDIKYFVKSFLAVPPALLLLDKENKTEQQINNSN